MMFHTMILDEVAVPVQVPHPMYWVSDLHLGDASPADDFAEGEHQSGFEWFLEHEVEAEGGRLILVGDVFEMWQCHLKDIREHYGPLFWRLHNYRLLRGNHDAAYRKPPHYFLPGHKRPWLLAEHGHEADALNSTFGWFGHAVTVFAGFLEHLGWEDIDQKTYRWKWLPTPVTRPSRFPPDHYQKYAWERARQFGVQAVILGHTHKAMIEEQRLTGVVYANCGSWVEKDRIGTFLRLADGALTLCEVV